MRRRFAKKSLLGFGPMIPLPLLLIGCGHRAAPVDEAEAQLQQQKVFKRRLGFVLDTLDATEAQRQQIDGLVQKAWAKGKQLRAERKRAMAVLRQQWQKPQADARAIRAAADELTRAVRDLGQQAAEIFVELHQILTPQQRTKLLQLIEEFHGRHHGHHGWH